MQIANFCLIIGTQKGGTTSLFSYLAQHPQVAASHVKETNFFLEERLWQKGMEYYESLWDWNTQAHSVALEASPNYTLSLSDAKTVAERIKTVSAQFKFIYVLREPVQKIESMRKQGIYQGWYAPMLEKETPDSLPKEVLEGVSYADIADRFVEDFSAGQILLLRTEELSAKGDQRAVMQKICRFLEIEPNFEFELGQIHNSRNTYREDTLWHLLRSSQYLSRVKAFVSNSLKNAARELLSKPPTDDKKAVVPLTLAQKAFIKEALSSSNSKFQLTDNSVTEL